MFLDVEKVLKEKYGLVLPKPPSPAGLYSPIVQTGNLVYISGQACTVNGEPVFTGKLGADMTVEQGQEAARIATINCLSLLKAYLKDLNKVKKIVQLTGYVKSADGFMDQPKVMNGASQLLLDVFGDRGAHSRLALGTNELPGGASVELYFIAEVE
jgi:enamine deaminase RidA (YjgF/YER057c/UK114 family)